MTQYTLGLPVPTRVEEHNSSTFAGNLRLPVHRWLRFSAGFSAAWAESVIRETPCSGPVRVLDPFAGSGTTLIAAQSVGAQSYGIEAHPFLCKIARAKLACRSNPDAFRRVISEVERAAARSAPSIERYPALVRECYGDRTLGELDQLRQAVESLEDDTAATQLAWLALVSILRKVARVNTAQWQYVLPKKPKKRPEMPLPAFRQMSDIIYEDLLFSQTVIGPEAVLVQGDARDCSGVPANFANLVLTSPPYPNNFDYADATRLEMSFMGEVESWGDLQQAVRKFLVRSCSQHVPESSIELDEVLSRPELEPIRQEISEVCRELAKVRLTKGGKKTYHLMVACYFLDLAQVWMSLRGVCASPSSVCFVVGDSAPYGVYVPVFEWLGRLAIAAGFSAYRFDRIRDRNVKWKNRKHRVPLCEGRLWVEG